MDAFHSRGMEPISSVSATISRRDALGKGRPCYCHFPAVHELSLPGTPHPAARRKRPGNADRRDLEKGRKLSPLLQDFVDACMESIL